MRERAETQHSQNICHSLFLGNYFWLRLSGTPGRAWAARLPVAQPALKWSLEGDKPRHSHSGTLQATSGRARTETVLDQWKKYSKKDDGKAERNQCTQNYNLLHCPSPHWRDWDISNVTTANAVLVETREVGDDSFVGCRKSRWFGLWQWIKNFLFHFSVHCWDIHVISISLFTSSCFLMQILIWIHKAPNFPQVCF